MSAINIKDLEEHINDVIPKFNEYIQDRKPRRRCKFVTKWGRGSWFVRTCDYLTARFHQVFPTYR